MLQPLLPDERLGRRNVDHESDLYLHVHLHAAERLGRRYQFEHRLRQYLYLLPQVLLRLRRRDLNRLLPAVRLRQYLYLLPAVRLRLVRQCKLQHQLEHRLRLQPQLRLRKSPRPCGRGLVFGEA